MRIYLDASALVKLVQVERESEPLRAYLGEHTADDVVTSALSQVEVTRAVLPAGAQAVADARHVLGGVAQIALSSSILDSAATLRTDRVVHTPDAIHLASAQRLGASLRAIVTYDAQMKTAADALALAVVAPA